VDQVIAWPTTIAVINFDKRMAGTTGVSGMVWLGAVEKNDEEK
jgi:hypothetical protein